MNTNTLLPDAPRHRLPRSLQPLPGESLSGYLINLAHRLRLTPGDLAQRLGILSVAVYSTINHQYALALPPAATCTFTTATGLTTQQAHNLTHAPHQALFLDAANPPPNGWSPQVLAVEHWIAPTSTGWCPQCLAEPHHTNASPDRQFERRLWHRDWVSPWLLACSRHQTLLTTVCPNEHQHATPARDAQAQSLIRDPRHLITHPTACRKRLATTTRSHTVALCGAPLDQSTAPSAAAETLTLQRHLDQLLAGEPTTVHSRGVTVNVAQYLRDLRLMAVLIQVANDPTIFADLPTDHADQAAQYLETGRRRSEKSGHSTGHSTGLHHKTWARPIPNPTVAATVITAAARLVHNPDTDTDEQIMNLVDRAMTNEPARWKKLRWSARPSEAMTPLLTPERKGIISLANLLRVSKDTSGPDLAQSLDHVPAYLDDNTYRRIAAAIGPHDERALRRTIPLGVIRHITHDSVATAANHLGYPTKLGVGASHRLGATLSTSDIETVRQATINYAHHVAAQPNPTNYAHRRRHFTPDWTIPDPYWEELTQQLQTRRITNKPSVLAERRRAYDTWVWAIITSGDVLAAPMLHQPNPGVTHQRLSNTQTLGLLQSNRIKKRAEHQSLIESLANTIATEIDNG